MIPLSHSLILGCALFIIGLLGVITRRTLIFTSFSLVIINASLCYVLFCVGLFSNQEDGTLNLTITLIVFLIQFIVTSIFVLLQHSLYKIKLSQINNKKS